MNRVKSISIVPFEDKHREIKEALGDLGRDAPEVYFIPTPSTVLFDRSGDSGEVKNWRPVITSRNQIGLIKTSVDFDPQSLRTRAVRNTIDHIKGISRNNTLVLHSINVFSMRLTTEDVITHVVMIESDLIEGARISEGGAFP